MIDFDFALLRHIGLTQAIASQLATIEHTPPGTRLARVSAVQRDWITLHDGARQFQARPLHKLLLELRADDLSLAVGDWVLAHAGEHGEHWLGARLTPQTHLARRGADGRRQSLASNVDTALLVMGLDHDFKLRRMERYLLLVESAGVAPVAVLTKADIGADVAARMAQLRQRLPPRVPAFAIDARGPQANAQLAPWLGAGQTLILLGTSGAGKSTLTNTLARSGQQTGAVRVGDSRGRHTTTSRSLHQCPDGACIIDTPGLRSWQADADEEALAAAFDDIGALAQQCQFRDCGHGEEPGCAVKGAIDPDRIRNYHKLLREAGRSQQTALQRIAERAKWKVLVRAGAEKGKRKRALD